MRMLGNLVVNQFDRLIPILGRFKVPSPIAGVFGLKWQVDQLPCFQDGPAHDDVGLGFLAAEGQQGRLHVILWLANPATVLNPPHPTCSLSGRGVEASQDAIVLRRTEFFLLLFGAHVAHPLPPTTTLLHPARVRPSLVLALLDSYYEPPILVSLQVRLLVMPLPVKLNALTEGFGDLHGVGGVVKEETAVARQFGPTGNPCSHG